MSPHTTVKMGGYHDGVDQPAGRSGTYAVDLRRSVHDRGVLWGWAFNILLAGDKDR